MIECIPGHCTHLSSAPVIAATRIGIGAAHSAPGAARLVADALITTCSCWGPNWCCSARRRFLRAGCHRRGPPDWFQASAVPVPTFCPSHTPYPGGFPSACNSKSSAPSMAVAVISAARHPLSRLLGQSHETAGFTSCCALDSCSPRRGFRHSVSTPHVSLRRRHGSLLPPSWQLTGWDAPLADTSFHVIPQRHHLQMCHHVAHPCCWTGRLR